MLKDKLSKLVIQFLKPGGLKDDFFKVPKKLNAMGTRLGVIDLLSTIIGLFFRIY